MSGFFAFLLIVTLVALAWSLIAPQHLAKLTQGNRTVTRKHTSLTLGFFTVLFFILAGATAPSQASSSTAQSNTTPTSSASQIKLSTVTTGQATETQPIAYTSSTRNDNTLAKGQTKIVQAGVNGTKTLTYTITYTDGQPGSKVLDSTKVTTQPVNEILVTGTYVAPAPAPRPSCTNGSYVNSAGNTVCSPESSSSAPAGASAQCRDGTYSFSQSRSGTCSHHGGVAVWL